VSGLNSPLSCSYVLSVSESVVSNSCIIKWSSCNIMLFGTWALHDTILRAVQVLQGKGSAETGGCNSCMKSTNARAATVLSFLTVGGT
jgi:hypothetical protein